MKCTLVKLLLICSALKILDGRLSRTTSPHYPLIFSCDDDDDGATELARCLCVTLIFPLHRPFDKCAFSHHIYVWAVSTRGQCNVKCSNVCTIDPVLSDQCVFGFVWIVNVHDLHENIVHSLPVCLDGQWVACFALRYSLRLLLTTRHHIDHNVGHLIVAFIQSLIFFILLLFSHSHAAQVNTEYKIWTKWCTHSTNNLAK